MSCWRVCLIWVSLAFPIVAAAQQIADVDSAVLQCLTQRVGAAARWSGGLVASASASARDKAHHPGEHELIGVGETYHGLADQPADIGRRLGRFLFR